MTKGLSDRSAFGGILPPMESALGLAALAIGLVLFVLANAAALFLMLGGATEPPEPDRRR